MASEVAFRKIDSGEVKSVKIGWSWTLFLFATTFGIPFFMRKAYPLAWTMVAWTLLKVFMLMSGESEQLATGADIGLAIALGLFGNRKTAEYYLKNGWEFADPDSDEAYLASTKWKLA